MELWMSQDLALKTRTTCISVAKLAGVGQATVSRVINNPQSVTPEKRRKVLQAIKMTGYRPSSAGRMLARQRHESIGLIFEKESVTSFYGARLIEGLAGQLSDCGQRLAIGMVKWRATVEEIEQLPLLKTLSVDGLILDLAHIRGDLDAAVSRLGLPYVYINPPGTRPYNTIMPDDIAAAGQATQYLIDRGHKKIGYIPCYKDTFHSSQKDRMRGYVDTLLRAGLQPAPLWDRPIEEMYGEDNDYGKRLKICREHGCTGIVTYTSGEALRMYMACCHMGLKIPQDMALIGCDFDPAISDAPIAVPTFHLDRMKMGQMAVRMLMERIDHPDRDIPTVYYSGTLIEDPRDKYSLRGLGIDAIETEKRP
jgi:DNA-binding LacI/PurR family transcriptional regulator